MSNWRNFMPKKSYMNPITILREGFFSKIASFLKKRPKLSRDEKCLFQSNFSCSFFDDSNKKLKCILPYPEGSLNSDNNINEAHS